MDDRETLTIPAFQDELDDFKPRVDKARSQADPAPKPDRRAVDAVSHFPSREASPDGQLNLKGPQHILLRFKAMCKADRRAYYDMLEILMNRFEGK